MLNLKVQFINNSITCCRLIITDIAKGIWGKLTGTRPDYSWIALVVFIMVSGVLIQGYLFPIITFLDIIESLFAFLVFMLLSMISITMILALIIALFAYIRDMYAYAKSLNSGPTSTKIKEN